MNQKQIFEMATQMGIKADLRGEEAVKKYLARQQYLYENLSPKKQAQFDKDRLTNPFMDSGIWVDNGQEVKKVLAGIDFCAGEVMLAKSIGADTILGHHPHGKGLAALAEVMHLHAEILAMYGVPINVAESVMHVRISEVARGVHAANHYKTVDAARVAGVNMMNIHTAADNLVADLIKKAIDGKNIEYVGELLEILTDIPEYKKAVEMGVPIKLFTGSEESKTGKIALTELTGGTDGSKDMFQQLAIAGIGTVVGMHMREEHRQEAEKYHINVLICGDVQSDSIGMNLILDEIEKQGVEIIPCGGLIRVKRN